MAKVIRNRWVYRPDNRWNRYLPRRNDGIKEHSYEFQSNVTENAPKLWMAWLYRDAGGEPKWTKKTLEKLFGQDYKAGKMEVFRNTPLVNEELYKIKHLIELRPIKFTNGEPTEADIGSTKILPNGRCEVMKDGNVNEADIRLYDEKLQLTRKDHARDLARKYHSFQSVFEDNVYTPNNITVVK